MAWLSLRSPMAVKYGIGVECEVKYQPFSSDLSFSSFETNENYYV